MTFSLSDTFNSFAKKAVADFPQLEGRFSIYSAPTETLHGSFSEDVMPHLIELQKSQVADFFQKHGERPHGFALEAEGFALINYIADDLDRHNYIVSGDPYSREIIAAMEHELGHLVVPGAGATANFKTIPYFYKECAAEAFSFIRQAQRFGAIDNQVARDAYIQASHLILRQDKSHFAVPVITEVARLAQAHDLTALTPAETANMACRLSLLTMPSNADTQQLFSVFRPAMLAYTGKGNAFEACGLALLEPSLSDIALDTGRAFIQPFLDGRSDIIPATLFSAEELATAFQGELWDNVRARLAAHDARPVDRFALEARDMAAFGRFDKKPDDIRFPAAYAADDNMAYLQRAQSAYAALRTLQETGKMPKGATINVEGLDVSGLSREQTIALAREQAAQKPVPAAQPAPGLKR